MHTQYFAAGLITFLFIGCTKSVPDEPPRQAGSSSTPASLPAAKAATVHAIHYPFEAYLSIDPEISVPAVKWAIENHEGNILESVWLRGGCPEARKLALHYCLKVETAHPPSFVAIIQTISEEAPNRIKEIEDVAAAIKRDRGR
jgi:hypothetical protein